jgi:hypothetical protein
VKKTAKLSDDEIRNLILDYFYRRRACASSVYGKKGSAAPISLIRKELKAMHSLTSQEVHRNLSYLQSQGFIEELIQPRAYRTPNGTLQPATMRFFRISALGVDKIDGPTLYTRDKFSGIHIDAAGQTLISIGDGNRINCAFREVGEAVSELRDAVVTSEQIDENRKLETVADLESIQDQLAKPNPNKGVVSLLWKGMGWLANIDGVAGLFGKVTALISHVTGQAAA